MFIFYSTGEQLAGLTAVLSDGSVHATYALLDTYTLCGSEPGYGPRVVTLECAAGAIGRYMYLYLPNSEAVLTLCEVEVYGTERKYWNTRNSS